MASIASGYRSDCFDRLIRRLSSATSEKFSRFVIYEGTYKFVGGIPVRTHVLVPQTARGSQKRPVIVRIHGGFLVTGSSLYPAWFSAWILDYAAAHGAVIVSPNYRLLPEVKGVDILQDMKDFWSWMAIGGPQLLLASEGASLQIDLSKILVIGGYLAIQSAFSHSSQIRAVIAAYLMLDLKSRFYTTSYYKPIVGVPNYPPGLIDECISRMTDRIITEADPPARLDLAMAIVQNGRLLEFLGTEAELFPFESLKAGKTALPPLFIFHGEEDSAVPSEDSKAFVREIRKRDPEAKVHLAIQSGDHGFDADAVIPEPWLRKGLQFVTGSWLDIAHP